MTPPLPRSTLFPYTTLFRSPNAGVDGVFTDWHKTTFVNYLRIAFKWGGFPGWERYPSRPEKELAALAEDRKSTRLNSSHSQISYAVFCLKKKKNKKNNKTST